MRVMCIILLLLSIATLCLADDLPDKPTLEDLELVAKTGSAEAQYQLGQRYYKGDGVDKDLPRAFELFSEAARHGHADAQFSAAIMCWVGMGTEKNIERSLELYCLAGEQEHYYSQLMLGDLYKGGDHVDENSAEALYWYLRALHQSKDESHIAKLNAEVDELKKSLAPEEAEQVYNRVEILYGGAKED